MIANVVLDTDPHRFNGALSADSVLLGLSLLWDDPR